MKKITLMLLLSFLYLHPSYSNSFLQDLNKIETELKSINPESFFVLAPEEAATSIAQVEQKAIELVAIQKKLSKKEKMKVVSIFDRLKITYDSVENLLDTEVNSSDIDSTLLLAMEETVGAKS